jgi:hypothetical protein
MQAFCRLMESASFGNCHDILQLSKGGAHNSFSL